jgi:hypothetical protein
MQLLYYIPILPITNIEDMKTITINRMLITIRKNLATTLDCL